MALEKICEAMRIQFHDVHERDRSTRPSGKGERGRGGFRRSSTYVAEVEENYHSGDDDGYYDDGDQDDSVYAVSEVPPEHEEAYGAEEEVYGAEDNGSEMSLLDGIDIDGLDDRELDALAITMQTKRRHGGGKKGRKGSRGRGSSSSRGRGSSAGGGKVGGKKDMKEERRKKTEQIKALQ